MNGISTILGIRVREDTCRAMRPGILFIQKSNQNFQHIRILQDFEQSGIH